MKEIYDFLKEARKKLRLSQQLVASRIGVSRQSLNSWEGLKAEPTLADYMKWKEVILEAIKEAAGKEVGNE